MNELNFDFQRSLTIVQKIKQHKSQYKTQYFVSNFYFRLFFFLCLFTCEACDCSHLGNNCDPKTGQCICPPNTIGETCSKCVPNTWGHSIISGCKVSESLHFI